MCVLGRWCDAAKIQWALLRKKKPRNEVRSLDMLGVGFGWQRQMRIGTFYQTKEKKDQEHRKMAHKFHGKKFVRPANIHKTHSHSHQTVNQQSHHWFILSQSFHLISNDYGWYGAIAVAVVFGFVIVCIFMSRTNMLREWMAYGRCDNNNSEQRTATVHETIAANDVSFAYFRLRLIDSQFKWHKSKLCYVVCRNFKSIFSNSNKTVHSNRNRKC